MNRVADHDVSGNALIAYTHGPGIDEPVAMNINGSTYFYIPDIQGSIRAIVDEDGNLMASYVYDVWGNLISHEGPLSEKNDYLYTAREYDWETGIYYYRARSYDSEIGRFLQQDPEGMVDGPNMYVYVGNDPVRNTDSLGTFGIFAGISLFLAIFVIGLNYCAYEQGKAAGRLNPYKGNSNDDKWEHCYWSCRMREHCHLSYYYSRKMNNLKEWWDKKTKGQTAAISKCDQVANSIGYSVYLNSRAGCYRGCSNVWVVLKRLNPGWGYC